jgi:hypothetical protein
LAVSGRGRERERERERERKREGGGGREIKYVVHIVIMCAYIYV